MPVGSFVFRLLATCGCLATFGPAASAAGSPGVVIGWGLNAKGQISVPGGLTNAIAIKAGFEHGLALTSDGSVVAWGNNFQGQSTPPPGMSNVIGIAAGWNHSLALHSNGKVTAWGHNTSGQATVPPGLSNVIAIAANGHHSLALKSDGRIVGWGQNAYGQVSAPADLSNVVAIATGARHSLALKNDGTVVGWGDNADGQLNIPVGLSNVTSIAAGYYFSLAVKQDGAVVAFGNNSYGQLNVPAGTNDFVAVAGARVHTLSITSDGRPIGWGCVSCFGVLPVPPNLSHAREVAAGEHFSLALTRAPWVTEPPTNQTAVAGNDVSFTVAAISAEPLNYQWLFNGVPLEGATNATLLLANVQSTNAGGYTVRVVNSVTTVQSAPATLTVLSVPEITLQPQNQSVFAGTTVSFNVEARGASPFSYQWLFRGAPIGNATNSTLVVTNAQFENQGEYRVAVSNFYGTTTTPAVFLEVRPTVSISDAGFTEGDSGTNNVQFTVSLSWASTPTVHVTYSTANGTAVAGSDYMQASGSIALLPGTTNQVISIPLFGDIVLEPDETFRVNIGSPNSAVARAQASGQILNDDTFPMIYLAYGVLSEGAGTNMMFFTLSLTAAFTNTVSVDFSTTDGSAKAGSDYVATSGRVIFPPGAVSQTYSVPILGDWLKETNESFHVNFLNPTNASLSQTQTFGTIQNDDYLAVPHGFGATLIARDLFFPTTMEFAPDGRLFVCQQDGKVWVIKDNVLLTTPFLSIDVTTEFFTEAGLLGLAFDPGFTSNQYVYVYYTSAVPYTHNRVSRFTADGDAVIEGSEYVLLEMDSVPNAFRHNGGAIHFGTDGKLFVGVGDNNLSMNSQSLDNLLGKLLRINSDGSIPSDNPFFDVASENNRAIWALGLRNPFEFAVQPISGRILINDVGADTWEEINEGVAGANYGWPFTEGLSTDVDFRNPLFAYGHGMTETNGCSITGGTFYNPATNQFPRELTGSYLFTDFCGGWIHRLGIGSGTDQFGFIGGLVDPVTLRISRDGSLYCLSRGREASGGGNIFKFTYTLPLAGEIQSIVRSPFGVVTLQISPGAGGVDLIQGSANLRDWTTIGTNRMPSSVYDFTDSESTGMTRRFYRILQLSE